MTIQVHPEVFLQLSSRNEEASSCSVLTQPLSCWPISPSHATVRKDAGACEDLADDDTLSTTSLSDCESEVSRTVSFAEELVTKVHTRPFTPPEQVQELYYSQEETSRYVGLSSIYLVLIVV